MSVNLRTIDFEPLVVIQCGPKTSPDVIAWIMDLLTSARSVHGAELLAFQIARHNQQDKHSILIGGDYKRLIEAGELMGLKKEFNDGTMREFLATDLSGFVNSDDIEIFLTNCEKQKIIQHELSALRADEDMTLPPLSFKFYSGELIVARLTEENIIKSFFPLHDLGDLEVLSSQWCKSLFSFQPLEKIQQYYGETIAMYFAFLGTYTMFLFPPAMLGVITLFCTWPFLIPSLCAVNMVWTTVFTEYWKRTGAELAYFWGTYKMEMFEEPRPQFRGELTLNPYNGRLELEYSRRKRYLKLYCVSMPLIFLCLGTTIGCFVLSRYMILYAEELSKAIPKDEEKPYFSVLKMLPTVLYGIAISAMNKFYKRIARKLNDWENHELQSTYENHLIAKLLLFTFINSFMSLFYIAFYLQDMDLLKTQLAALLITQQVTDNFQETVMPYLLLGYRKKQLFLNPNSFRTSSVSNYVKEQVAIESTMEEYSGTFGDYTEMWIQFGYVYLFSAVFPLAAFCGLINNIYEIRTDAFKFCKVFRRPFAQSTSGIGVWQAAFEIMSIISVMTNCALLALSNPIKEYLSPYQPVTCVLIFVLAEHLVIIAKTALAYLIPDVSYTVERAITAAEFEYRQMLRYQNVGKKRASRASLNKTFKSVTLSDEEAREIDEYIDDEDSTVA